MIARALLATITNAVSATNKGVFFMTTSLLRALSINAQILSVVQNEPAMAREAAGSSHFGRRAMPSVLGCLVLPTCGVIPLFHRRFRVSYLIQIPKAIRLKVNRCRALSSPPPPKRLCGYVRTRPRRGLAGVVAFVCGGSRPLIVTGI